MSTLTRYATCLAIVSVLGGCNQQDAPDPAPTAEAAAVAPATTDATLTTPLPAQPSVDRFEASVVADATPFQPEAARVEGNALVSTGTAGFVMYGPYATLARGRYELVIEGRVDDVGDGGMIVDVASRGRTFAEQTIASPQPEGVIATLGFDLDQPTPDVEFRVRVGQGARIRITGYRVANPG